MQPDIRCGALELMTIFRSWQLWYLVNGHSHHLLSLSANDAINSMPILLKHFNCLKCFIQQDLLFCELQDPSVLSEYGSEDVVNEEIIIEVDDSDINLSIFE